ncbi:sensor histidine kinase [Amycolatopsis sp. 195334CR]|uniref:sensor histidine kinase n=1 Tax=Amycolatopsis sp. 195334CR TaxID=2814588 RepID=UPI0027DC38AF|nr:sensor histidine kinase [Amycolatopsis sp. 195334CR]
MPGDLPLEQPVELKLLRYWELFYLFVLIAGLVALQLQDEPTLRAKLGASALLVAGFGWYWWFGHRHLVRSGGDVTPRVGAVAVAGVLACFFGAMLLVPDAAWASPSIISQVFWLLPLRVAVVAVVLISFVPGAISLSDGDDLSEQLASTIPAGVIFCSLAVMLGLFIHRIAQQKEEQALLIERLAASRSEVARLSHEAGTAAERERLAREIHDTLAQGFTSIVALVQAIESELDTDPAAARRHLELTARTARENLDEARSMVAALTPSALAAGTLADAVRRQADRLADETALTVTCRIDDGLPKLPTAAEVVLLRATQEALHNTRRHAHATTVALSLSIVDGLVRLSVWDDGVGFDPDAPAAGYGLAGMRARAQQVGGELTVHCGERGGTELVVEVPG